LAPSPIQTELHGVVAGKTEVRIEPERLPETRESAARPILCLPEHSQFCHFPQTGRGRDKVIVREVQERQIVQGIGIARFGLQRFFKILARISRPA
jgi:hypothetical protein